MIEATITLAELKRAVVLVEQAHAKGYTASVAVLTLASCSRSLDECVLVADGLPLTDGALRDGGRRSSAADACDLTR